jgi:hypothetical protein
MLLDSEFDLRLEDRLPLRAFGLAFANFDVVGEADIAAPEIDLLDNKALIFWAARLLR